MSGAAGVVSGPPLCSGGNTAAGHCGQGSQHPRTVGGLGGTGRGAVIRQRQIADGPQPQRALQQGPTARLQGRRQQPRVQVRRYEIGELISQLGAPAGFSSVLAGRKQHVWPFFCLEGEWNRGKPALPAVVQKSKCFAFAEKQGWVWRNPGHSRASLRKEVERWLQTRNIKALSPVLDSLCAVLPLNARALQLGLDKLGLYLNGRQNLEAADSELFTARVEIDIFAFLQALQNKKSALRVWTKILQEQGSGFLFPFLGLMTTEARSLWQLTGPEADHVHLPPVVKDNKIRLARALGRAKIISIFDLLVRTETDVKSGRAEPEQALELLVVNLGRLFT